MDSKLLSGKIVAQSIYKNIKKQIIKLNERNIIPGLAVILVGERSDSQLYVHIKQKKCKELFINSFLYKFKNNVEEEEIIKQIELLNNDQNIHGILIQLPLPNHLNEYNILNKVAIEKDVDGFHSLNFGNLAINSNPLYVPCTPEGCLEMLNYYNIDLEGKHVVLVGCSKVVGLPAALMSLHKEATVSICHIKTQNIKNITRMADILIVACGVPHLVKNDWVKDGVIIIDVGMNKMDDPTKKRGYRLVGDVDFEGVYDKVKYITPVPGGVGPMTVAMLMKHCVENIEEQCVQNLNGGNYIESI